MKCLGKILKSSFVVLLFLASFFASAKNIVIGISLPTQRDVGWVRYKKQFELYAKKAGVDVIIQSADQDPSRQSSQVDNLLSEKIDILLIAPQDATAGAALVEKAHKSKVRVISFDRLILNSNVDYYVSFDNFKVGELQGQYLKDKVKSGNIIVLSGAPTDNNSFLFKAGAMKSLEPAIRSGKLKIVMEQPILDWQPSRAQQMTEDALTKNKNNIQGILAPNDNTAGGVIQALAAQQLAGKVIVTGMDGEVTAAKRILNGTQSMTVFKDQNKLAEVAIQLAVDVVKKGKVNIKVTTDNGKMKVPSILLAPVVVDKNNLEKVLIQSGYLKRSDVY